MPHAAGDALLPALQPWAAELHAGYRDYVAAAPPGWLEPGSRLAAALEARLSQASGAAVALLLAAFGAAEQPMGFAAQVGRCPTAHSQRSDATTAQLITTSGCWV